MGLKRQRLCSFFFVTKWANCANNPGTCTIRDGNCEGKMRDSKQFWKCRTVTNGFFWTELFRNPFQLELHSKLLITNYREVVKKKNGFTIRLTIKVSFLWFFGVSKGTGVFRSKNSFQWVKIFIFSYGQGWWAPSPYSQPDRKISAFLLMTSLGLSWQYSLKEIRTSEFCVTWLEVCWIEPLARQASKLDLVRPLFGRGLRQNSFPVSGKWKTNRTLTGFLMAHILPIE